jgi:hypothetical protein
MNHEEKNPFFFFLLVPQKSNSIKEMQWKMAKKHEFSRLYAWFH